MSMSAAAARVRMYANAARYLARSTGSASSWPAMRRTVSVSRASSLGSGAASKRTRALGRNLRSATAGVCGLIGSAGRRGGLLDELVDRHRLRNEAQLGHVV